MESRSLTEGSVVKGLVVFIIPLMFGQLLQQMYNVADAWVIGNFADNASFAAVSSVGTLAFLIVGFFMGLSVGAGVVIARYFGACDYDNMEKAIHTTVLLGIISSVVVTIITVIAVPGILRIMKTPDNVLPYSIAYMKIYCGGISTIIMYNVFMSIMRALGDSLRPLYYLCLSSVLNIILDMVLVAVLHQGVYGAAFATILSQGISVVLCFNQMQKSDGYLKIHLKKLRIDAAKVREIVMQGLPAGIQNSALSLGNIVVQSNVNTFGEYAMAGMGAHARLEGFVFIPVISISMGLSTFVSQNIGAGKWDRVKRGGIFGVITSLIIAQIFGVFLYIFAPQLLGFFTSNQESLHYGCLFARRLTVFYMALAFSHGASGILQGMGKAIIPMAAMLSVWCVFRICFVTAALMVRHEFEMICWAYPVTWSLTSLIFIGVLIRIARSRERAKR